LYPHKRHVAAVGFARDDMTLTPITYDEMRQGCWDPKYRLEDMTLDHVDKSLAFPTFPRFCGQTFYEAKDRETALECVYAYNNWMIEEWCGDSGGRLLPLQIIPLWDAELAAAEVRRNSARGCHAVCFSEIPTHLGLPSIHSGSWDPFFAACAANGVVVNMHIGSSSSMATASPDAPPAVQITLSFNYALVSMCDYLFSGLFGDITDDSMYVSVPLMVGAATRVTQEFDPSSTAGKGWLEKMAGQMGNERVTTLNLEVVQGDAERGLLLVKGAGSQGVQNGAISCIALPLALPGGIRGVSPRTSIKYSKAPNPGIYRWSSRRPSNSSST